tara:strand:+ start:845 stop:1378 length:534 start_codon:yes stop_codon:yes gene_type:complete
MSDKNYQVDKETVKGILNDLINIDGISHYKNKKYLVDLLLTLSEDSISALINLSLMKDKYVPIKLNDSVKYKHPNYSIHNKEEREIMIDKGLMDADGYIFGSVIGDGAWSSIAEFNPYFNFMKVNFYIWSNDKMEIKEEIVTRASLEIIKESDIPDYHGKDQLDFFKENIKDLEHKL